MPQSGSSRDLLSPSDHAGKMWWLPSAPDVSALQAMWEQSDKHGMPCRVKIRLCSISGS